jgi:flagellar biosynthesis protein FlhA
MARNRAEAELQELHVLRVGDIFEPFAPWRRDEQGKQIYIKLTRAEEISYLFVGSQLSIRAELQQALMRLVNDGWTVEGEVVVQFNGRSEPGTDPYVYREPLILELGKSLLPLVDPQNGAPLLAKVEQIREEVAREVGVVIPPVRVTDNLQLDHQYLLRIKDAPVAIGEIFLDRLLVLGSLELLGQLEGWTTQDPVHRLPAKWVSQEVKDKAEGLGCPVLGPLAVMVAHVKGLVLGASAELLGLQECYDLIHRLRSSHPVVVEEFLADRRLLRQVRKILTNLLEQRVAIRDLVTVLEVCGDHLDMLDQVEEVTERCRLALSRQLCASVVDGEGKLRVLALGPVVEQRIAEDRNWNQEQLEAFHKAIRKAREEHHHPNVLVTDTGSRRYVQRWLGPAFPDLTILSTDELVSGFKVEVAALVELPG